MSLLRSGGSAGAAEPETIRLPKFPAGSLDGAEASKPPTNTYNLLPALRVLTAGVVPVKVGPHVRDHHNQAGPPPTCGGEPCGMTSLKKKKGWMRLDVVQYAAAYLDGAFGRPVSTSRGRLYGWLAPSCLRTPCPTCFWTWTRMGWYRCRSASWNALWPLRSPARR